MKSEQHQETDHERDPDAVMYHRAKCPNHPGPDRPGGPYPERADITVDKPWDYCGVVVWLLDDHHDRETFEHAEQQATMENRPPERTLADFGEGSA